VAGAQAVSATLGLAEGAEDADVPTTPAEAIARTPSLAAIAGGKWPAPAEVAAMALFAWRLRFEVLLGSRANRESFELLVPAAEALEPPFPPALPAALRTRRGAALLDGAMARVEELMALAAAALAWPESAGEDAALLFYAQAGLAADIERRRGLPCVEADVAAGDDINGSGGNSAAAAVQRLVDDYVDVSLAVADARKERACGWSTVDKALDVRSAVSDHAAKATSQAVKAADGGYGLVRNATTDKVGATNYIAGRGISLVLETVMDSLPGAGIAKEVKKLNEYEKKRRARLERRAFFLPLARAAYRVLLGVLEVVASLPVPPEVAGEAAATAEAPAAAAAPKSGAAAAPEA